LGRESELTRENKVLANNVATLSLERNRNGRDIELLRRQIIELKAEQDKVYQEKSSMLTQLKQVQHTSDILNTHIHKLKADRLKLRSKLKRRERELENSLISYET
jgi:hypothetical protein